MIIKTILNALGLDEDENGKSFRLMSLLFIQFVLVSINLFAGFVTNSMSLTACVGYHLINLFIIGDEVVKKIFPDTKVLSVGRIIVMIFDSLMALGFSAIVIDEFFDRLNSPFYFSEPLVWTMLITSMVSTIKSFIYGFYYHKVLRNAIVSLTVFVSMVVMKILDFQAVDSYVGLGISLFVVYLSVKMIVRVWNHRKSF